jgi:hypothetical protein
LGIDFTATKQNDFWPRSRQWLQSSHAQPRWLRSLLNCNGTISRPISITRHHDTGAARQWAANRVPRFAPHNQGHPMVSVLTRFKSSGNMPDQPFTIANHAVFGHCHNGGHMDHHHTAKPQLARRYAARQHNQQFRNLQI